MFAMRKTISIGVISACVAFAASAQDSGKDRLSSLRDIFQTHLEKLKADHTQRSASWPGEYGTALRALQKVRQTAGDLDGWTAVNDEIKRFGETRRLAEDDVVRSPAELARLQEQYVKMASKLGADHGREVLELTEKYTSHLLDMQKELTRAGRMEEALAAREEIQRAKSLPAVTAAEFEAALHNAERPPEKPVVPPASPESGAGSKWQPKVPVAAGSGATLYGPNLKPPAIPGATLRHTSLSATGNAPMGSRVSARLWVANSSAAGDSYSDSGKRYNLRARVVATGGKAFKDATLVLQVYVKHRKQKYSYGSSGKIVPSVASVFKVSVPLLDKEYVHFDSPRIPQKSRYGSMPSAWYGRELYGAVLSVFSSDGELLYQGASAAGLRDAAIPHP